ncbi:MAG: sigma factor G inhibitor Gin [Syntrophomonadaceae bacterium]|nr:sigma factor G inhibitor Gin [Syntrophomonadaceae bacterium]
MNLPESTVQKEVIKGILLPRCRICQQVPPGGIRGGIKFKKAFICRQCEEQIVVTQVGSPGYEDLMEKMKQVLK